MGKKKMLMRKFGSATIVNNTFIGGVASVINTPALLAAKLQYYPSGAAFSENDIQNFTVVGSDIECYIGVDYQITNFAIFVGTNLNSYNDIKGYCKLLGNRIFENLTIDTLNFPNATVNGELVRAGSLREFYGLNVTKLPNLFLANATGTEVVYVPNCLDVGNTVVDDSVFTYRESPPVKLLYVHPSLATVNSGQPDGDIQNIINKGGEVRYVTNFNKPQRTTDLTVNTVYATAIKLDLSVPTSTNAIDYYEVYVDGVFYKIASTNEVIVTGLTNLQTYNFSVIAVDIFYNKSEISNIVTQQINGVGREWLDNLTSYYQFENNILDSVGTNNGVATDITYASGQVGNAAVFNGSTSFINCGNATNLQSYPISIVTVVKTSNAGSGYRGLVTKQFNYGLYLNNNVLIYYDWNTTTAKSTGINLADNNYHTVIKTIDALGNVNVYVDAVLVLTDTITLVNTNEDLVIGAGNSGGSIQNFNGSMDDTSILNKELSPAEVTEIDALLMTGFPLI